jgi:signal transduction histidine kinase
MMLFDQPFRSIIDHSPAEISVIEMTPGKKQFGIVFINKTKAAHFGIDAREAVGKKCYQVFEPHRKDVEGEDSHCKGCPSLQAFQHPGQTIHRDWQYIHPLRKEIRWGNLSSQRLPGRTQVVEIVRDCTTRKVLSDISLELANVRSYQQLEAVVVDAFLNRLYFSRYRLYLSTEEGDAFVLKSFYRALPDPDRPYQRTFEPIEVKPLVIPKSEAHPSDYLFAENPRRPRIVAIPEYLDQWRFTSRFVVASEDAQFRHDKLLSKADYPIWVELPLQSATRLVGKICLDIPVAGDSDPLWRLEDYDVELLGILGQSVAQAWENMRLLTITDIRAIDEIVMQNREGPLDEVLSHILTRVIAFLQIERAHILVDDDDGNATIIDPGHAPRKLPISQTILARAVRAYRKDNDTKTQVWDPVPERFWERYAELGNRDVGDTTPVQSCMTQLITDQNGDPLGIWYLESDRTHAFNEFMRDRMHLVASQTGLAIQNLKKDLVLKKKREQAIHNQMEAEKNLKEKESFFRTTEHEMIAPIDPIMKTFSLFKRRIEALGIEDKRLQQLPDEGIQHCQFLNYTFSNLEFLRSDSVSLNLRPVKLFKQVIIPVVETMREYAKSEGIHLEYVGHQRIAMYMELDVNLMRNVFFNLLRNAIRYSEKGTVIYIRGIKQQDNLSVIEVENTGIAIPEKWKERIFELYQRAGNARTKAVQGSGIGLYVTRNIIEAHGGHIYVSHLNAPTVFTIELPDNAGGIHETVVDR